MYLYNNTMVAKEGERNCFHTGRIKVLTNEQFIPLFLALTTRALSPSKRNAGATMTIKETPVSAADHRDYSYAGGDPVRIEKARAGIEAQLRLELQEAYPSEYTLFSPDYGTMSSGQGMDGILRSFFGDYVSSMYTSHISNYVTNFGLVAKHITVSNRRSSVYAAPYNDLMSITYANTKGMSIAPMILMLVKAKYLSLVRASIYLKQPLALPVGGLKILRVRNLDGVGDQIISDPRYSGLISGQAPIVEYTSTEVISAFLMKPLAEFAPSKILESAIEVENNPAAYESVIYG